MELLEDILLPYVEFLCTSAIKFCNESSDNSHIVLVGGGKAFNEYVEKEYRKDSFDYDCKIYISNSIVDVNKHESIIYKVLNRITNNINTNLEHFTAPYIIYSALYRSGIDAPDEQSSIVEAYHDKRVSYVSGMTVYYIYLVYRDSQKEIKLPVIMEFVQVMESEEKIQNYYNAMEKCINLPRTLIDQKRFFVPFDDLLLDIKLLSKNNNYPKQQQMANRLRVLEDAISNNKLVCEIRQDKNSCLDSVIFDFTEKLDNFKVYNYPQLDLHKDFFINNKNLYYAIQTYTGASYSDINKILWYSYLHISSLDEICEYFSIDKNYIDTINKINTAMYMDKPYDNITAYRNCSFMDFKFKNSDSNPINMYNIQKGMIIDNVSFISCTLTNQNSVIEQFNHNSQFKGCIIKVNITTPKGYIVIANSSMHKDEKEIILDYKGGLKVTNVSFKYTTEYCKGIIKYMERLFIEADYVIDEVYNTQPKIVFVDNKIINNNDQEIVKEIEKIKLYEMTSITNPITNENVNENKKVEKIDTKFGSYEVPVSLVNLIKKNENVLGLSPGVLLNVVNKLPGKNKIMTLIICLFILVLIIFIYKYYTTTKNATQNNTANIKTLIKTNLL